MNRRTLVKTVVGTSALAPLTALSQMSAAGQLADLLAALTNVYVSEGLSLPKAAEGQFLAVVPNSFDDSAVGFLLHNNTDGIVEVDSVEVTGNPALENSYTNVYYAPRILHPGDYALGYGPMDQFDGSGNLSFRTNMYPLDEGRDESMLTVDDVSLVGDKIEVLITNQHDTDVGPDVTASIVFFNDDASRIVGICPAVVPDVEIPAGETFSIMISDPIGEVSDHIAACAGYGHLT